LKNGKIINVNLSNDHSCYQFLCLSKDASYLLGNDNEEQFLFIRNCYHHLANIILNNETNGKRNNNWRVTGNPGIGKTHFSYFLLYQLAQQNKTVIYDSKDNECTVLFKKYCTLYCNRNLHRFGEDTSDFYHIAEDERLMYMTFKTNKTILITSPWKYYYKYHVKEGINTLYMSVWSWEEINICRYVNFHNLSQEEVWELYKKWGGIPLYTLDYALNESKQKLLQRAIDICDDNLFRYFGEMYFKKDISYMIAHIFTNEKNEKVLQFASEYISEKIVDKLEVHYNERLINIVNYQPYSEYSSLNHAIFEHIAHRTLLNGGSFDIHLLSESVDSNSKLTMSKREKLVFSNINDIEPDKYCIPSKKNFICDINAIVLPNKFFIMAVSEEYLKNMNNLDKLIDKFIDKSDESIIELYFVTPKYKVYNGFFSKEEVDVTIAINKDLSSLNDRIRQYALKLDMNSICGNKDV
jgi:hypothetical protein